MRLGLAAIGSVLVTGLLILYLVDAGTTPATSPAHPTRLRDDMPSGQSRPDSAGSTKFDQNGGATLAGSSSGQTQKAAHGEHTAERASQGLDVEVLGADGEPVAAYIVARPAPGDANGAGVVLRAEFHPPGLCRVSVPRAGGYEVGAVSLDPGRPGVALAVIGIEEGERGSVRLVLKDGDSIRVVTEGPWRIEEGRESVLLTLRCETINGHPYPGWLPACSIAETFDLRPGHPWTSPHLPADCTYSARVAFTVAPGQSEPAAWWPVAHPARVSAGQTVHVRLESHAELDVSPSIAAISEWQTGPVHLTWSLIQGGEETEGSRTWDSPYLVSAENQPPIRLSGRPGPARLEWSGPGTAPGSTGVELMQGARVRVPIELYPQQGAHERDDLVVRVRAEGSHRLDHDSEHWLKIWAVVRETPDNLVVLEEEVEWEPDQGVSEVVVELDGGWRRAEHLVAAVDRTLVSRPTMLPAQGDVSVALLPAGLLIVVPRAYLGDGRGQAVIRREDGLPFLWGESQLRYVASFETMSEVLGPLPEGSYIFETSVAGSAWSHAEVEVAVGAVVPVPVR